jgi:hypothetical protein
MELPKAVSSLQHNRWNSIEAQKSLFDRLGKELNVSKLEDWYKIKAEEVSKKEKGVEFVSLQIR